MNTPCEEPTRNAQVTEGAELEQAALRLHEELTQGPARRSPAPEREEQAGPQTRIRPQRSSRRKMLSKGLGMAAVASIGAGALLELSNGTAQASSVKPGVFASSTAGTPAVKATGTNGADGVDATSDSGTGVSATSTSGTALVATSSHLAGHFVGNVAMDNNLTVSTLKSGAGTFSSSMASTSAISATGINGADGVDASSDSGTGVSGTSTVGTGVSGTGEIGVSGTGTTGTGVIGTGPNNGVFGTHTGVFGNGVFGQSSSGTGVHGSSSSGTGVSGVSDSGTGVAGGSSSSDGVLGESDRGNGIHGVTTGTGLAGLFDGNVQVNGNFSATGTKNFVQAHPTDPGREIVYVALEGGEAGTYVRGSGQLQSGKAVIALPEHFGLVTATKGLTIQLTPRCEWLQLYVVELDTAQLVVREAQGKSGTFDYFICGVRRGYEQYEVIRTKR